jgi:hypothetical protein
MDWVGISVSRESRRVRFSASRFSEILHGPRDLWPCTVAVYLDVAVGD